MKRLKLILILFCFGVTTSIAQKFEVNLNSDSVLKAQHFKDYNNVKRPFKYKLNEKFETLERRILKLQKLGYLCASIDSINKKNNYATIYIGPRFEWGKLGADSSDLILLADLGFRQKLYNQKVVKLKEFVGLKEDVINYLECNGYPFANVKLDHTTINASQISAVFKIDKGKRFYVDSIVVKGGAKTTKGFIYNHLQIKPKDIYNELRIGAISKSIKELPYLSEIKPASLTFNNDKLNIDLFLVDKQSSQFDGLVGFLPDANGDVNFTGQAHVKLQNQFKRGELIDLNWRRLQVQTQDLKVISSYPYFLNTRFGLEGTLKLYRKDSTFIDVSPTAGLLYLITSQDYLKFFVQNRTSSLINTDGLEFITHLPDYADISNNMFGVGAKMEELDYRFNPRKGYKMILNASLGQKIIYQNPKVNQEVYKAVNLNSTQYALDLTSDFYVSIGKQSVLNFSLDGASLIGATIFKNELFRIGGLSSLRGFDEESIFASSYAVGTFEYRLLFEKNSFLYLFTDAGWYENNSVNEFITDTPYGYGAGITFETKAGLFTINYALGQQFNNPPSFRAGKVHFGIVSYF